MALSDDPSHQRDLLRIHLRRLMLLDENRTQRPNDVNIRMERDRTIAEINGCAARLGLGGYPEQAGAIVAQAGLDAEYAASLGKQRQRLGAYRKVLERQHAAADELAQVNLDLALQQADELLGEIGHLLEAVGAPSGGSATLPPPPSSGPATPLPPPPTDSLTPDEVRRLRDLLRRCDEYFDTNRDLRALFADARLAPWRGGLPEAESLSARVDRLIDYLRDKRNAAQERALILLLQALAERYDPSDARHGELLALARELQSPARPTPTTRPESATPESSRRAPMLPIAETMLMLARAASVAQISIGKLVDGRRRGVPTGSAWLIAPDLALTCWHVVHARGPDDGEVDPMDLDEQIRNCLLTFVYTEAGDGVEYGVARLEHAHRDDTRLDYALLRLRDRDDAPLARHTPLALELDAPLTQLTDLFIVQHPSGQPQQQSSGTFERELAGNPGRILYTNRTEGGASGAPVFNRSGWRVVALHHGTNSASGLGEGILLGAIAEDLRRERPDLFDEIMGTQPR